jgi:hypothetical protein
MVPLSRGGIVENGFNIGDRLSTRRRVLLAPPLFGPTWRKCHVGHAHPVRHSS